MKINIKKRNALMRKEGGKAMLFLFPSLAGITVFVLLPFMDVIRRSFCDAMGRKFVGMANYILVLNNKAFQLAAGNTAKFIIICIPVLLLVSLGISLLLKNQRSRKEFLKPHFYFLWQFPWHP